MDKLIIIILLFSHSLNGFAQLNLSDSLRAYYPFYGDASDLSGNGLNATVFGATPAPDRFGNDSLAFEFDGIDDYINTFTSFDFEFRSVSVWAKPYNTEGNGFFEKYIIGQDDASLQFGQLQAKFSLGNIEMRAGGEANHQIIPAIDSLWFHIVLVRDGDTCLHYLNNVLVGRATSGSLASTITPNPQLIIGAGRTLTNQYFQGIIDDIRIYNRALSSLDVDNLYNEGNPILSLNQEESDMDRLKLYPNPAKSEIFIESSDGIKAVKLMSITGQLIMDSGFKNSISINGVSNGIYLVQITFDSGRSLTRKVSVYR